MREQRRRAVRALGLTLASLLVLVAHEANARDAPRSVTLLTGDRVIIGEDAQGLRIVPGNGRSGMRFITRRVPSTRAGASPHLHVIPEDAVALIAADKVDPRLFDVTRLLDDDCDDSKRDSLPLIVTYPKPSAAQRTLSAARALPGANVSRNLPVIDGVAANTPKARVNEVWAALASAPAVAGGSVIRH